ncbi:hypothetical protein [Rickettsiella massiliensis]|uniref:hypothetical protein n=1 Tax=Rickettsiella massiliensis TaxID=676517 RepID=UPI00029A4719|nr:hypothetical protein [Rickettsiella massiliensis]
MLNLKNTTKVIGVFLIFLLLAGCTGGKFPKVETMLTRLNGEFPSFYRLITASAYMIGIAFIFRGVYQLKVYGDLRTMMSVQTNFKATMLLFLRVRRFCMHQQP